MPEDFEQYAEEVEQGKQQDLNQLPCYTKSDYLTSTAPFEFLYAYEDNPFVQKQLMQRMSDAAKKVGVKNFVSLYNAYTESVKEPRKSAGRSVTEFTGQPMELWCGAWEATDRGIKTIEKRSSVEVFACPHPIMPVRRLVNVDDGTYKVELAYRLGGRWRSSIEDKRTISDSRAILSLAGYGIAVNSDNAKYLVRFLADLESLNYERIPETPCVGRL